MSSPAIDQILQFGGPIRPATDTAQPVASKLPAFQEHLERAASEVKSPQNDERDKPLSEPEPESLTSTPEHQDAAASQQEETQSPLETEEQADSETEEQADANAEVAADDVVISESAAALVEPLIPAENIVVNKTEAPLDEEKASEISDSDTNSSERQEVATAEEITTEDESKEKPNHFLPSDEVQQDTSRQPENKSDDAKSAENSAPDLQSRKDDTNQSDPSKDFTTAEQSKLNTEVARAETTEEKLSPSEQDTTGLTVDTEVTAEGQKTAAERKPATRSSSPVSSPTKTEPASLQIDQNVQSAEPLASLVVGSDSPEIGTNSSTQPLPAGGEAANTQVRTIESSVGSALKSSTDALSDADPTSTVNRARFVQRVGGAIRSAQNRDGRIQLQLSPPELGSLRVEIIVKGGVVTAHLETETSAARTVLLDNLPALRERLAEQEIRIEKFDVDVRRDGQQADNPGTHDRPSNRQSGDSRDRHPSVREETRENLLAEAIASSQILDNGLDVRV